MVRQTDDVKVFDEAGSSVKHDALGHIRIFPCANI